MGWVVAGVVLVVFLAIVASGLALLELWGRWLGRTAAPPRLVAGLSWCARTVYLLGPVGVLIGFVRAFSAVGGESIDPSQKARILGEGISEAMNAAAFGIMTICLGVGLPYVVLSLLYRGTRRPDGNEEAPKPPNGEDPE